MVVGKRWELGGRRLEEVGKGRTVMWERERERERTVKEAKIGRTIRLELRVLSGGKVRTVGAAPGQKSKWGVPLTGWEKARVQRGDSRCLRG